jgi:transcriptional regulator with PAS, ATPase and Fis domain
LRAAGPYVRVNCAAIPEPLVESQLFGHERGAFTGAVEATPGFFEAAHGGTLLLDEVGELPPAVQAKLLRVVEDRQVLRAGAVKPRPVDVRIIAATNRDLERQAETGRFRSDLFYRLNGICLLVPPLRERTQEIVPLATAFVAAACARAERAELVLSPAATDWLLNHSWPGNVRELRNVIERAVVVCTEDTILREHLPVEKLRLDATASAASSSLRQATLRDEQRQLEKRRMQEALEACGGNQSAAARLLGMPRRTFVMRLAEYHIARPRKPRA